MGHENGILEQVIYCGSDLFKPRRLSDHIVGDAGEHLYVVWDRYGGFYQAFESVYDSLSIVQYDRYFGDVVIGSVSPGCFYINDCVHRVVIKLLTNLGNGCRKRGAGLPSGDSPIANR